MCAGYKKPQAFSQIVFILLFFNLFWTYSCALVTEKSDSVGAIVYTVRERVLPISLCWN